MRVVAMHICLWIAVVTVAVSVGGNVFQMTVVDPLWNASPPESVQTFSSQTALLSGVKKFHQNPLYLFGLACLLASPFLAWNRPAMRNWLLLGVMMYACIIVVTLLYFYPMNRTLGLLGAHPSTDARTLVAMTHRWIFADRIRQLVRLVAFLCVLRAMTLSGRPTADLDSAKSGSE
jgi:uncharacterized membrane protein